MKEKKIKVRNNPMNNLLIQSIRDQQRMKQLAGGNDVYVTPLEVFSYYIYLIVLNHFNLNHIIESLSDFMRYIYVYSVDLLDQSDAPIITVRPKETLLTGEVIYSEHILGYCIPSEEDDITAIYVEDDLAYHRAEATKHDVVNNKRELKYAPYLKHKLASVERTEIQ